MRARLGARVGRKPGTTPAMSRGLSGRLLRARRAERRGAAGSTTRRSPRCATSTATCGIDGRVLDLGGAGRDHFEVPPDELVAFDGDPTRSCPTATTRSTTSSAPAASARSRTRADTFAEVARVLQPGGHFVCTFAARSSPSAVRGWATTDDAGRVRIAPHATSSGTPASAPAESDLRTSLTGAGDRLWAVWAAERLRSVRELLGDAVRSCGAAAGARRATTIRPSPSERARDRLDAGQQVGVALARDRPRLTMQPKMTEPSSAPQNAPTIPP